MNSGLNSKTAFQTDDTLLGFAINTHCSMRGLSQRNSVHLYKMVQKWHPFQSMSIYCHINCKTL